QCVQAAEGITCETSLGGNSTRGLVAGTAAATKLVVGAGHACAVIDGTVQCWGNGTNGALGPSTFSVTDELTPIPNLSGVPVALAAGHFHTCALFEDGRVMCWGANESGAI